MTLSSTSSRPVVLAALFAAGVVLLGPTALRAWGSWLIVEDTLQPARAVVVLGGHVPFRAIEAAAVHRAGWAPEVWLTEGAAGIRRRVREHDRSRRVLERRGVPPEAIRLLPGRNANTAAEVLAVGQAAEAAGGGPVIVVTSKSHTRRVRVLWRQLVGDRVQLVVRSTPDDPFDPDAWWQTRTDAILVARESFGLLKAWVE